jgi:hypothetical protein
MHPLYPPPPPEFMYSPGHEDFGQVSLFDFTLMMLYYIGPQSAMFVDYGNYCGYNGDSGYDKPAIDDCDQCCLIHDQCYGKAKAIDGGSCNPYTNPYVFFGTCRNKEGSCARFACECDQAIALCLKKALEQTPRCGAPKSRLF